MNAYVRALSVHLHPWRLFFERHWFLSQGAPRRDVERLRREWADELLEKWNEYARSAEFRPILEECRRKARAEVSWMSHSDIHRADQHAEFAEADTCEAHRAEPNPFRCRSVRYKPAYSPDTHDRNGDWDVYWYLGVNLAATGSSCLPSSWIHSHADDPDESDEI